MTKTNESIHMRVDDSPDERRANREGLFQDSILTKVRRGGAADLRRAVILAESGIVQLSTVRGVLGVLLRESLGQRGISEVIANRLRKALDQLERGEEVVVPFSPNGVDLEEVRVPFSLRD